MTEAVKMAIRAGLVGTIAIALVVILTTVPLPEIQMDYFGEAIGHGKAILQYYLGARGTALLGIGIGLFILDYVVKITIGIGLIAVRWIMKVNEG